MPSRLIIVATTFIWAMGSTVRPTVAQEVEFFRFQFESQLTDLNQSATSLLAELVKHPKEARDAALVVSQYPDLIVRLRYADRQSPGVISALTLNHPPEVSVATATLVRHFEVVELLTNRLIAAGLLGQVYDRNPEQVEMALDRLSERTSSMVSSTLDAWRKRLEDRPAAASQLSRLVEPGSTPESTTEAPVKLSEITSLPSPEQVALILINADTYPDLASEIVDQWELERNPDAFRRAVDIWYAHGRDVLPGSFIVASAQRTKLLSEYAKFEREYVRMKSGTEGDASLSRFSFLHQHADAYPMLMDVYYQKQAAIAEASRPKVAGAPYTSGSSGGGGTSRASTRSTGTRSMPARTTARAPGAAEGGTGRGQGGFGGQGATGGQGGFGGQGGSGGQGGFGGGSSGIGGGSSGFGAGSGGGSRQSGSRTNRISGSSSRQGG